MFNNSSQIKSMLTKILSLLFVVLFSFTQPVFAADKTNDTLMPKGMWKDPATGLIWDRCSVGQTWNGNTCLGEATAYNWADAVTAAKQQRTGGFSDWQLPSIAHLASIRSCSNGFSTTKGSGIIPNDQGGEFKVAWCKWGAQKPTLDTIVFPNTSFARYWSSSAYTYESDVFYVFDFLEATLDRRSATKGVYAVRAVRTAQVYDRTAFERIFDAPFAEAKQLKQQMLEQDQRDYPVYDRENMRIAALDVANNNIDLLPKGMWKDPATGNIWDRCSLGQTWNGRTCVGEARQFKQADAIAALREHNRGGIATGSCRQWQICEVYRVVFAGNMV